MLVIKAKFGEDLRRLQFEESSLTFASLEEELLKRFHIDPVSGIQIFNITPQGQRGLLSNDFELQTLVSPLKGKSASLRFELTTPKPQVPISTTRTPSPISTPTPTPAPTTPSLSPVAPASVSSLLSDIASLSIDSRASPAPKVFHAYVNCDGCRGAINGVRYKCGHCPDFDFCESCERTKEHFPNHVFLKITSPISRQQNPLWFTNAVFLPVINAPILVEKLVETPIVKPVEKPVEQPTVVKTPETPISKPAETETTTLPEAIYVSDISVPDGTSLKPGSRFTKTWLMKNTGTCKWPAGTALYFVGGNPLGALTRIVVPSALPDQSVEISVVLTAPQNPGRYLSYWRLGKSESMKFGHRVWCDILVEKNEVSEAASSQTVAAETPEPAPVSSTEVSSDQFYPEQMKQLLAKGFFDRTKNLRLLRQHNGDLNVVIPSLLKDQDNDWFTRH